MALQGKGFLIWKVANAEAGNPQTICNTASSAGLAHVVVKIADGAYSYNIDKSTGKDLVIPLVQALRTKNIQAWGWHYIYGDDPQGEANRAIQRVKELNLDGYVIDAEMEFDKRGMDAAARQFMTTLRNALPNLPIALSSFRFPSYHPTFPWKDFLEKCDLNMPQVYWVDAHNPTAQLDRCIREFQALAPFRPILPTGIACYEKSWYPTESDINEFLNASKGFNLPGANFWDWDECKHQLPKLFDVVSKYSWPTTPSTPDIAQTYIAALNSHNPNQVSTLYQSNAVLINASRTIQGIGDIRNWYTNLFQNLIPNGQFTLTGFTGAGSTRHLTWQATSTRGAVPDGNDTIGLVDNKISYHYTSFTQPSP